MTQFQKRLKAALAAAAAAAVLTITAGPALAAPKPVAPTANAIRTAGGKVVFKVDGKAVKAGQIVGGRHIEARVYVPAKARFAKPVRVFLADYEMTTFDLRRSNQRFLQARSTLLVPGQWSVLRLKLRSKRAGKPNRHQLDLGVGRQIDVDKPYTWLGTYPRYTGKQLLGAVFVKCKAKGL